jgi:predicted nucleotidyltransferase
MQHTGDLEAVPVPLRAYLHRVATTLELALGDSLVGVYGIGSVALGDWIPGRSDVDVAVVVRHPLDAPALHDLAEGLDNAQLPVPARKLELVVYELDRLRRGDTRFLMNLNTGSDGPTTVDLDPSLVPRFWFVLDLAIAHRVAIPLRGPAASDVWAAPSERDVRSALAEGLRWYGESGGDPVGTLLAASRAWHHLATGQWTSKTTAARWAARELATEAPDLAATVTAAAAVRATGTPAAEIPLATQAAARLSARTIALLSP